MSLAIHRQRYLRDQFHGLTLAASVQRAQVYSPGTSELDRAPFQVSLRTELDNLSEHYSRRVTDDQHVAHIRTLALRLSHRHASLLQANHFRIGPAQKALNLFLKYLWCAELIPMPPHCPFDYRVIATLPPRDRVSWTKLDDIEAYRRLVAAARAIAGAVPLAEWELRTYNTVSTAATRAP